MNGFQRKLALFEDGFARNPTLLYFQSCQEMLKDVTERRKHFSNYRKYLETLQQQFTTRFQNLVALQPRLALFTEPLAPVPIQQPPDAQLQLCELQSLPFFQTKRNEPAISFWKLVPATRFPALRDFALSMASMFGSTYLCEKAFFIMTYRVLFVNRGSHSWLTERLIFIPAAIILRRGFSYR